MGYKLVTKMEFHSEKPLGEQTNCRKSIHRENIISLPFTVIFKLLGTYFLSLIHGKKKTDYYEPISVIFSLFPKLRL